MKLRAIALLALLGVLIPVWAGDVITHETRVNRQRITTVLNAPGGVPVIPQTSECVQNRQRITTIYDLPGTVRNALPNDRQFDRRQLDMNARPKPIQGKIMELPLPSNGAKPAEKLKSPPKQIDKEEVSFQDKAKEAPPAKVVPDLERGKMREEKLTLIDWRCGRQMTDDKNRRWHLIQGTPQMDKPREYEGWIMQAADSPIYFFSRTGRMWRMTSQPLS